MSSLKVTGGLVAGLLLWSLSTWANDECLGCHTAASSAPVHAIFTTAHASIGAGTGMELCTSCHGDSTEHRAAPTQVAPTVSFGPRWPAPAAARIQACRQCHSGRAQSLWEGSVHQREDLTCDSCHQSHRWQDAVLTAIGELGVCSQCHVRERNETQLPSHHPIAEGKTRCSDCHNVHGSSTPAALVEPSLNETCYGCHSEKRGPFLWEHAPATEDCALCHTPHGGVNPALLTSRAPFLCQQCHLSAFHPSQIYDGRALHQPTAGQNLAAGSCLNCHGQIHGSNHPSGSRLTR